MQNEIFSQFLADERTRTKILQEIRDLVRTTALEHRNVTLGDGRDGMQDDAERIAQTLVQRMMHADGKLRLQLHRDIRFGQLADNDLAGFLTVGERLGVLGKRASDVIRNALPVVQSKVNRREGWELRRDYRAAASEVNSADREYPSLNLERNNNEPIDRAKLVRNLTEQDFRAILDIKNCDGITALEILTLKVFIDKSHERLQPTRRHKKGDPNWKKAQSAFATDPE